MTNRSQKIVKQELHKNHFLLYTLELIYSHGALHKHQFEHEHMQLAGYESLTLIPNHSFQEPLAYPKCTSQDNLVQGHWRFHTHCNQIYYYIISPRKTPGLITVVISQQSACNHKTSV